MDNICIHLRTVGKKDTQQDKRCYKVYHPSLSCDWKQMLLYKSCKSIVFPPYVMFYFFSLAMNLPTDFNQLSL